MSLAPDIDVDTSVLDALDFAAQCDAHDGENGRIMVGADCDGYRCEQEATHTYDSPRCEHCGRPRIQALLCTGHAHRIHHKAGQAEMICTRCNGVVLALIRPIAGAH